MTTRAPVVEVLGFAGCPNTAPVLELVEGVLRQGGIQATVRSVSVDDPEQAMRLRFLGSPSVRVNGRDIEPGAADRSDFVFACRIYRTESGLSGRPDARWLRNALTG